VRLRSIAPAAVAVGILACPIGLLLCLWAISFIDPAASQNDCALNLVSKDQYLQLLAQANAQKWTVWPGLSRGIIWPSDQWYGDPSDTFATTVDQKLTHSVESLTFDHDSPEAQLAAAHAVMRSIGAEFVSILEAQQFHVNDTVRPATIWFTYFIPQRRFAPLCVGCLLWWFTTIDVHFDRDQTAGKPVFNRVVVLFGNLKYDPQKEKQRNAICPEFPSRWRS
jgi:hypothetical protein